MIDCISPLQSLLTTLYCSNYRGCLKDACNKQHWSLTKSCIKITFGAIAIRSIKLKLGTKIHLKPSNKIWNLQQASGILCILYSYDDGHIMPELLHTLSQGHEYVLTPSLAWFSHLNVHALGSVLRTLHGSTGGFPPAGLSDCSLSHGMEGDADYPGPWQHQ